MGILHCCPQLFCTVLRLLGATTRCAETARCHDLDEVRTRFDLSANSFAYLICSVSFISHKIAVSGCGGYDAAGGKDAGADDKTLVDGIAYVAGEAVTTATVTEGGDPGGKSNLSVASYTQGSDGKGIEVLT